MSINLTHHQTQAPAAALQPASAMSALAHPLGILIQLTPRGEVQYAGTAAQLIEEGVVTQDFQWPVSRARGVSHSSWERGIFDYFCFRHRPEWVTHEQWRDMPAEARDYGTVTVRLTADRGTGFAAARMFDAEEQLRATRFAQSTAGAKQWKQWSDSLKDTKFRALLEGIGATRKSQRKARKEAAK
jgi:hypothetical protein